MRTVLPEMVPIHRKWYLSTYSTGHTDHLEKRMAEYQIGQVSGYTATRLPVERMFSEEFSSREEAWARERQIKGWSRGKKEALMRNDWVEISRLARKPYPSTNSG